jgi:hypothetical protein
MSKQWGHGYHTGLGEGFVDGSDFHHQSGIDYGRHSLAKEMYYLLEQITIASEDGDAIKKYAFLSIAQQLVSKYYQPEKKDDNAQVQAAPGSLGVAPGTES